MYQKLHWIKYRTWSLPGKSFFIGRQHFYILSNLSLFIILFLYKCGVLMSNAKAKGISLVESVQYFVIFCDFM